MIANRRALLAGLGLAGLAAPAVAQSPAPSERKPTLLERFAAAAPAHRRDIAFDGAAWSGPGLDFLLEEGRQAQFFMVGEEHGIAQVPALVGQLANGLSEVGFSRLALEISPPAARALDQAAGAGVDGLADFFAKAPPGPAFYTMAEEARMLAAIRATFRGKGEALLGLDYEISLDRMIIADLMTKAPASAKAPMAAMKAASDASWARYAETKDLTAVFCFSGDPALVRAVIDAWPNPDPRSAERLATLEASLTANRHYTEKRYFRSNESRADFSRANWVRYWSAEQAAGRAPKVLFKFGAGHMVRGRSMTEVYDLGSLVSETAALAGGHSFHLLAVPLDGRQAYLDPETFRYASTDVSTIAELALEPLAALAPEGKSAVFDLRPLRPLMSASVTQSADPRLTRIVHGYDAVLFIRDSRASANL